jgi:hypothetical protein
MIEGMKERKRKKEERKKERKKPGEFTLWPYLNSKGSNTADDFGQVGSLVQAICLEGVQL